MSKPTLGYWDIRGLATPIRYLLEFAGVEYEEKLYHCGPPPTFDRSEWLNEKFNIGLLCPNLPYLIDGDIKIGQSAAIMRHLARKHQLDGKTEADKVRVDAIAEQLRDYHMDYVRVVYNPEFLKLKEGYLENLPNKLKYLSELMDGRKFVTGDYVTYADFVLFEYLEFQSHFVKDLLKDYPVLDEFHKRILALEAIDKYFKSPRAIKYPFNGGPAMFGGPYSDQMCKE